MQTVNKQKVLNLLFNVGSGVAFGVWMGSVAAGIWFSLVFIQTIYVVHTAVERITQSIEGNLLS